MNVTIEVDGRGRAALGKVARPGPYRVTTRPDGSVLLEPARILTESEISVLRNPDLMSKLQATFDGTIETVDFDWK